jgi:hypothetical protein
VATVKQLTASKYQVTVTGTELALMRNALHEAERVSRFGKQVLDDVGKSPEAEPSENSRLRREIDVLAMREISLRLLQKTMTEVDHSGSPAQMQHPDLEQLKSGAALQVPRSP